VGGVSVTAVAAAGSEGSVAGVATVVAISAAAAKDVAGVGVVLIVMMQETNSCCRLFRPTVDQRGFSGATGQPISYCQLQVFKKLVSFFMRLKVVSVLIVYSIRKG